jgi:hypothetical protein
MTLVKTCRVELINMHCINAHRGLFDITFRSRRGRKSKARRRKQNIHFAAEIQELIDSRVFSGLAFNMFQHTLLNLATGQAVAPRPVVFRLLFFLEYCDGLAVVEDVSCKCWKNVCSKSAIRNAVLDATKTLETLGIKRFIECSGDKIQVSRIG